MLREVEDASRAWARVDSVVDSLRGSSIVGRFRRHAVGWKMTLIMTKIWIITPKRRTGCEEQAKLSFRRTIS